MNSSTSSNTWLCPICNETITIQTARTAQCPKKCSTLSSIDFGYHQPHQFFMYSANKAFVAYTIDNRVEAIRTSAIPERTYLHQDIKPFFKSTQDAINYLANILSKCNDLVHF